MMVVDQVRDYLEHGNLQNAVNFPDASMPRESPYRLAIANANVPDMLGRISHALGRRKINIHNMLNKSKGEMAYTLVDVDTPVPARTWSKELCGTQRRAGGALSSRKAEAAREAWLMTSTSCAARSTASTTSCAALLQRRAGARAEDRRAEAGRAGLPARARDARSCGAWRETNSGPLAAERVVAVFREIISACRALEEAIRVAYLGPEGTFSEQAVRKHFGRAVEALPVPSIDEAFRRCESGAAQFTVVPVENSTEGVVGRTLDLLLTTPLRICGEIELRVQQNLLSERQALKDVTARLFACAVAGAVQRLACAAPARRRAHSGGVQRRGGAARREGGGAAAIAGEAAAERYDLDVLARSIEDEPNNTTRFLVLGKLDPAPTGQGPHLARHVGGEQAGRGARAAHAARRSTASA